MYTSPELTRDVAIQRRFAALTDATVFWSVSVTLVTETLLKFDTTPSTMALLQ